MSESFLKIAEGINVRPLEQSLNLHPELWDQHNERRVFEGSPHAQMTDYTKPAYS